jgi:hypothetical protein
LDFDKFFRREPLERAAGDRSTDAKLLADSVFGQLGARLQSLFEDGAPQGLLNRHQHGGSFRHRRCSPGGFAPVLIARQPISVDGTASESFYAECPSTSQHRPHGEDNLDGDGIIRINMTHFRDQGARLILMGHGGNA